MSGTMPVRCGASRHAEFCVASTGVRMPDTSRNFADERYNRTLRQGDTLRNLALSRNQETSDRSRAACVGL